ncbi:uncharacterized protein EV422DRAFT_571161 [Fimicolochytrium jonesii]|uniref:uncharacterized protein n=1 Tax=Fimicolochytrium jonesii TaxID=1396493 RepID=UPI0022FEFB88|nr:uncharacterized protein EV422DRAFT_571161 [Fimicolochytrium jonesii]KAI8817075.1 hypothetical protein EV422DRAFT_571161 [Fimicolochytrium jonesii]
MAAIAAANLSHNSIPEDTEEEEEEVERPNVAVRPLTVSSVKRPGLRLIEGQAFAYNEEGLALLAQGKTLNSNPTLALSLAKFDRAIQLLPTEPTFFNNRAEAHIALCDFESAIANFRHHIALADAVATKSSPTRSMAASPMSSSTRPATRANGDVGVHASVFVLTRKLAPIAYTWGNCLFDMKRFEEALRMFEYAMGIGMRAEAVLLKCALAYIGLDQLDAALEILYKLTEAPNPNIELYIVRAKIYRHLGNVEFTNIDLQRALLVDPTHPELAPLLTYTLSKAVDYKNFAWHETMKGHPLAAIQYLTHALDLDEGDVAVYKQRGILLAESGQYEGAIQDLEKVLSVTSPADVGTVAEVRSCLAGVYVDIGLIAYQKGELQAAITSFTEALGYSPDNPIILKNRADCHQALGHISAAITDLAHALEIDPDDDACRERCALLWAIVADHASVDAGAGGEWRKAVELWGMALQYDPLCAEYFFRRARVYYRNQKINEAYTDLLSARALDPTNVEIYAMVCELQGGPQLASLQPFAAPGVVKRVGGNWVGGGVGVVKGKRGSTPPAKAGASATTSVASSPASTTTIRIPASSHDHVLSLPPLSLPKLSVKEGGEHPYQSSRRGVEVGKKKEGEGKGKEGGMKKREEDEAVEKLRPMLHRVALELDV